jgi:glycine betaine/proline transport system substrate-binding protein
MKQHRLGPVFAGLAILSLLTAACSSGGTGSSAAPASPGTGASADPGTGAKPGEGTTVNIAINPWVGYEASAAVVADVLEKELGYTVAKKNLAEQVSWEGFETGEVDVIIENWGHDDLKKTFIEERGVAVDAGPTGNLGIIGWYVPPWLAAEHPDILDWNNLNTYAQEFKTSESGEKGQFLAGDPGFVTNDAALVKNLGLDFEVVYAGSEAALIEAFRTAEAEKQWLIGYFYEPQWFLAQVPLKKVALPAWTAGCDADPEKVACDYPEYVLDKIVSKTFADEGGAAYEVVKNFTWTNDDQNVVADYINEGMTPEEAGARWVTDNEAKWKAWLPAS